MQFRHLIKGQILKRYKRFLVDVELENSQIITAYCPNTGSMKSCYKLNSEVFLSYHPQSSKSQRKYPYTLELTSSPYCSSLVCVNTHIANKLVHQALLNKSIDQFKNYDLITNEPKINKNTKLDFLLQSKLNPDEKCYIEVKHVTYYDHRHNLIMFPDAVSTRAQKHLSTLLKLSPNHHCALVFVIARNEGKYFCSADHIDIEYAKLLRKCLDSSIEILPIKTNISTSSISLKSGNKSTLNIINHNKHFNL